MTADAREQLRRHLLADEGLRLKPYTDTVGKLSIGVGRNLTDVGISGKEALVLLENDIDKAVMDLVGRFPWVIDVDVVRQVALVNLTFNMGINGVASFVNTMAAAERHDWAAVVEGLKLSKWFRQVQRSRSTRIIEMFRTGAWPNEQSV